MNSNRLKTLTFAAIFFHLCMPVQAQNATSSGTTGTSAEYQAARKKVMIENPELRALDSECLCDTKTHTLACSCNECSQAAEMK